MKTKYYISQLLVGLFLLASCQKEIDGLSGIGVNAFTIETLSSSLDSEVILKITRVTPHELNRIDIRDRNGKSLGIVTLTNGVGTITLDRDALEEFALKSGGNYTLTTRGEIQIQNINFISLDDPRCSMVATVLIP